MHGKPIAAAVFVALIAILLTLPLRDADRSDATAGRAPATSTPTPEDTPTPEPTPSPTPTAEETDDGGTAPFPKTGMAGNDYPGECLERVDAEEDGRVAYYVPGGIDVTALDGSGTITIGEETPFAWSPSGSYLATGSGSIYEPGGAVAAEMPTSGETFHWGWSPIADCALVADEAGILVVRPGEDPVRLIYKPVERFAFSPTGGTLAYVRQGAAGASIWQLDLNNRRTEEIVRLGPLDDGESIVLAGWEPDGSDLYYWVGQKTALLDTGANLRSATSGTDAGLPPVLAHTDFVTTCNDRTLAVIGGGARTEPGRKRLSYLEGGDEPTTVTSPDDWVISPTCSPDGAFIAAVRSDDPSGAGSKNLSIFDIEGNLAETLTTGSDFVDASPLWGKGDAGLMFLRAPSGGGAVEVWRAEPGGSPGSTGITVDVPGNPEARRDAWGRFVDWSADVPTGLSITTGSGG
jgi:hypothetical protein